MSTPTNQQKVVFALSSFAGLVSGKNPPPNPDLVLYNLITAKFKEYQTQLGKWNIVWGPIVVTYDTFYYPINAMYVAQSGDDPSQYVFAVAGTNPVSVFDWLVEDALVEYQLPWVFDLTETAKISLGTAIGLTILLTNTPSSTLPGAGLAIRDFLAGLSSKKITLMTTGHSLGGALSPTLGLWLKDTQILWDPFFEAKFASMPSAGPTAGNSEFAEYLSEKIPLTRFWNTLDIVPHAWEEALLAELPTIYAPDIPDDLTITYFVSLAQDAAKNGDYTQIEPDSTFSLGVNTKIINPLHINIENYLAQVAYQHTVAYTSYFAFPGVDVYSDLYELEPAPTLNASVLARQSARTGTPPAPELLTLSARADAVQSITVPVNGKPTHLPASAGDPATATIAATVQAELKKLAK
jgi:hypothetical protein